MLWASPCPRSRDAQRKARTRPTHAGTYKKHGQSPSCVQAELETEETGRDKHPIERSGVGGAGRPAWAGGARRGSGHECSMQHADTPGTGTHAQSTRLAPGWAHGHGWAQEHPQAGSVPRSYQGLVGREHGGVGAVPVQGHQGHGAEFLLGEVGGGAPAHDDGAQVVVLRARRGVTPGCVAGPLPSPLLPSPPSPACTHLSLKDAGGPVPQLSLPRAHQVPAEETAEELPGSRDSGAQDLLSPCL